MEGTFSGQYAFTKKQRYNKKSPILNSFKIVTHMYTVVIIFLISITGAAWNISPRAFKRTNWNIFWHKLVYFNVGS